MQTRRTVTVPKYIIRMVSSYSELVAEAGASI